MMDRITYEIVRNALYTIAREMKIAMMHTAGSPVIHSGGDASAAIFDAQMQLVAQGNDIPTMLGSAVVSTKVPAEAMSESLNYSERLVRAEIRAIPDGVYLGKDLVEPVEASGWPDALIPIKVKISANGRTVDADATAKLRATRA